MIENIWFIAAFWMGLALVASLVSIRLGISVALIEILVGCDRRQHPLRPVSRSAADNGVDQFSGDARQRGADVSGRGGD